MCRVFLSYARSDGEAAAGSLREKLAAETDIEVLQDHLLLEGGVSWWQQVKDAIDSVDFLLLVATPAAMASGNVEREWRYARQQGVRVYPVKGPALNVESVPRRWMRKAHFHDLPKEWPTLVGHLHSAGRPPRVKFMAPDLPAAFVQRPKEFQSLKTLLLSDAITTALTGAGGYGKTTLAAALCHDSDIQERFDDGILWVTLGQTPNLLGALTTVYAAVTDQRPPFLTVEDGAFHLAEVLADLDCLLVIDDVWDSAHLRPFLRNRKRSSRLFTTRNSSIASDAQSVNVDEMRLDEAIAMLPDLARNLARDVARKLGEWPIALELAAAAIRERVRLGDTPAGAAKRLNILRSGSLSQVVESSLQMFDEADRRRFTELSVFPEDVDVPLAAAAPVWGFGESDAEDLAIRLARLSLVKLDLGNPSLRLHDVMKSWLSTRLDRQEEIHDRLIASWADWTKLPYDYAWRWLPWHLARAGRVADLRHILWDPAWLQAKLRAANVFDLVADYDQLEPGDQARLVQGGLRLAAHTLAADPAQFASQLTGRLLPLRKEPSVRKFLARVEAAAPPCWFHPLHPALHAPGSELVRTLEGHTASVDAVAVTRDGSRAVSASWDKTLIVWDLESGRAAHILKGHEEPVSAVAVEPEGRLAVSGSWDGAVNVWDLDTGTLRHSLREHAARVTAVAFPSPDCVLSASGDSTVRVWHLDGDKTPRILRGHKGAVTGLSADANRAVSGVADGAIFLWDLHSGALISRWQAHSDPISAVALGPGPAVVSASSEDGALKVWNPDTCALQREWNGHKDPVLGVAIFPDGKRAISASADRTVKVWDLASGRVVRALVGHADAVNQVAVAADGLLAVSASGDCTVKVWDLATPASAVRIEQHDAAVNRVAASADGSIIVSASADKTLKVWSAKTGRVLRTLRGHEDVVAGVAVSSDGRFAVSASWDKTGRTWDLKTGRQLRVLEGHSDALLAVALSPDGQTVVTASWDRAIRSWDRPTGALQWTVPAHSDSVSAVALSTVSGRVVTGSWNRNVKVWSLGAGELEFYLKGHTAAISDIAISSDGALAVSASEDRRLIVWDLASRQAIRELNGHSDAVRGVLLLGNTGQVVSAASDKTLRLWDLSTGRTIAVFYGDAGFRCCTLAGDVVVAGDDAGRLHFLSLPQPTQSP